MRATLCALLLLVLLTGCNDGNRPPRERQPPPRVALVAEVIAAPPAAGLLTTVGYLYIDADGARLVGGLTRSADELRPLGGDAAQIWLDTVPTSVAAELRANDQARYGAVRVAGTFAGPGRFGPDACFRYQLVDVTFTPLVASEVTIALLENNLAIYEQQVLQLRGNLLVGTSSALLVDQLGSGGVPAANARQIKLAQPIQDEALLAQLQGAPGAAARFGPVTIEGFWQHGVLYPLLISAE
ncbi:hypothetical protein HC891_17845 [Candidatus Gracilibacteria bacterium]|nr:hypothetical protein [Candidatus Gracilibacteria bacterium]